MSATIWECHNCGSVELQSVAEPTERCICCKAVQWHNTRRAPSWKMQRDCIAELEAMATEMVHAVPGGSICDPQQISDALREIAAKHGVTVADE